MRVLGRLGVKTLILTNAAGGINTAFAQGALMVIDDHINLLGSNPLIGPNDDRFGPRFPDMTEVYSRRLRATGRCRRRARWRCRSSTASTSPCTGRATRRRPRFARSATLGADAVGMSTVPEAIVARHMGIEVLGISCIIEHGGRRAAAAAPSRRGDGDDAARARPVHRAAGGHHWPTLTRSWNARARRALGALADYSRFKVGAALETAERRDHHRLQHRERHLRPDHLRRARRDVQGAVRRPSRLPPHRRRRRHARAHAAVRRVPADPLGVRRRHRGRARQSRRRHGARTTCAICCPARSTSDFSK